MLEHLLELLLHAKSGAVAAVLLVGTTGALVTATVQTQNGVTTITLTQASASPTSSPTGSPNSLLSSHLSVPSTVTGSGSACSEQAHLVNGEVKRVNDAFAQLHQDLNALRKDAKTEAARESLETASESLGRIRQAGVKAIHATFTCREDDEDKDNDEDKDDDDTPGTVTGSATVTVTGSANRKHEDKDEDNKREHTPAVTFIGTDPKAIADQAIAAMKLVVDTAKANLPAVQQLRAATPRPTPTIRTRTPRPSFSFAPENRSGSNSGSGSSGSGREGHD